MSSNEPLDAPAVSIGTHLSVVCLFVSVAAAAYALYDLPYPPFTDAQLRENFVDTWEAHMLGSFVFLIAFLAGLVGSLTGVWRSKSLDRIRFYAASAAFLLALLVQVTSMNVLTTRTERVTGHVLHWL